MGKNTSHFVRLGIFVITGSALLLMAAYLIGSEQQIFSRTFELTTVFENVAGLQEGNNVRFSGINVGTVKGIVMETDTSIRIYMRIDSDLQQHIKKNAIAVVGSDGLVGSMLINILPDRGESEPVESGDEIRSYSRISTQDMLTTLNVTNENAALLTADLLQITQALKNGSGTLGRLLHDTTMATDFQASAANLRLTSARAASILKGFDELLEELRIEQSAAALLLDDPEFADQIRSVATNLDSSSVEILELTTRLNGLVSTVEQDRQGTLGVLLHDSISAQHLQNSLKHLDSGLQKFDENMEALKHNFLTRRYFRRLEKEKAKSEKKEQ